MGINYPTPKLTVPLNRKKKKQQNYYNKKTTTSFDSTSSQGCKFWATGKSITP